MNIKHYPILKNSTLLILIAIIMLGFILRIYGIPFGLPYIHHPDEHYIVEPAVQMVITNDLNPHQFIFPSSTFMYILHFFYRLYYFIGRITGEFSTVHDFEISFQTDSSIFYLIGRTVAVLFGIGSILLVYLIGKRTYNPKIGLAAAFFLSISLLHIKHSQIVRPDIISSFFILLSIFYCLLIIEHGTLKYYLLAGFWIGVAIASKWVAGLMIIPILVAFWFFKSKDIFNPNLSIPVVLKILLSLVFILSLIIVGDTLLNDGKVCINNPIIPQLALQRFSSDGELNSLTLNFLDIIRKFIFSVSAIVLLCFLAAICIRKFRYLILNTMTHKKFLLSLLSIFFGFFLFAPFALIEIRSTLRDLSLVSGLKHIGVESTGILDNFFWYISVAFRNGLGLQILLLAFVGILFILFEKRKRGFFLLLFPLIFFIFLGQAYLHWERWAIPIIPFLTLFAGFGIFQIIEYIKKISKINWKTDVIVGILCLGMSINLILRIIEYNRFILKKDTRVECKEWIDKNIPRQSRIAQEWFTGPIDTTIYHVYQKVRLCSIPIQNYIDKEYDYILVSSWAYNRIFEGKDKYVLEAEFYNSLFENFPLLKEIQQDPKQKPGPTIRIYQIGRDEINEK